MTVLTESGNSINIKELSQTFSYLQGKKLILFVTVLHHKGTKKITKWKGIILLLANKSVL